jgi:hypothetical protein
MPSNVVATGQLNLNEVVSLLRQVGFPEKDIPKMVAIALAENEPLDANKVRNTPKSGDLSYGIFQINMIGKLGTERRNLIGIKSNEELLDPLTNARAALVVYNNRKKRKQGTEDGLTAWSSYNPDKNGVRRYEQFLPEATQLVTRTKPTMIPSRSRMETNILSGGGGMNKPITLRVPTDLNDIAKIPVAGKEYTLGAAQDLFVKGDSATKNEILTILKQYDPNTNYKKPDTINTAWNKLVQNYSISNSVAQKPFTTWLVGESEYNREISGTGDGTSVFLQPSITPKEQALEDFNTFILDATGSAANPADAAEYYKELNKLEKSKVAKQVTTRSGSTTTQTATAGVTKEDRELLAAKFVDRYIDTAGVKNVGGAVGANLGTIRKLASDYNIALSDAEIRRYAVSALTDKNVLETAKVKIKNTAKVRYQNLAPYIDQDLTVKDIASQYINRMANVLEINPDTVKLDNRYIDTALSTLPNFTDFNKILRGGPEWPFTLNAREEAASIINKVKSDFQVA